MGKRSVISSVLGPGILDGIEMVTCARSRGTLKVNNRLTEGINALDAADGHGGSNYPKKFTKT